MAALPEELKEILDDADGTQQHWLTKSGQRDLRKLLQLTAERNIEALKLYEPTPFQDRYHACVAKECLMSKGNQVGGQQPLTSQVLTPTGWVPMGAMEVGDLVIGGDGKPCTINRIFEYGDSPVFRFHFSDGTSTEAGPEHNWTCRLGGRKRLPDSTHVDAEGFYVRTTEQILRYVKRNGYRETGYGGKAFGHYRCVFPVVPPVEYDPQPVPIDPYTLGVLIGDGNYTHSSVTITSEDVGIIDRLVPPEGCTIVEKDCSQEKYGNASLYAIVRKDGCGKESPILSALRALGVHGARGHEKSIPRLYLVNSVEVRLELLRGLMDTDGHSPSGGRCPMYYTSSRRLAEDVTELVRSLGGKATVDWRPNSHCGCAGRELAHICISGLGDLNPFKLPRKAERYSPPKSGRRAFRTLEHVEYVGTADSRCLGVDSRSHTYVTDDFVVTHNSICGFAEDARAATGQDPYGKYPKSGGVIVCVGYGEGHIGRVIHKYLFRWGAFEIIRDEETGIWRTYRPWPQDREVFGKHGDLHRSEEARPAPPFIPKRFIKGDLAWKKKNERVFSLAQLINGWEIHAMNSQGESEHSQGFQANLCHIDEDVATDGWVTELTARLSRPPGTPKVSKGYLRWTAMPHAKTEDIVLMLDRAKDEESKPKPETIVIYAGIDENPYISDETKESNKRIWRTMGDEEYLRRVEGRLVIGGLRMYPAFDKRLHNAIKVLEPDEIEFERHGHVLRAEVQKILTERHGLPPVDWCRYFSIDPGYQIGAGLFLAVPPPRLGNYVICYDELYISQCTASKFAKAFKDKWNGDPIYSFIFDFHGGKLRSLGTGEVPVEVYEKEFASLRLQSLSRGHRMTPGCDNIEARELAVRELLSPKDRGREAGFPSLLICIDRCPNLVKEIEGFRKQVIRMKGRDIITDKGDRRAGTHLVEAMEQAVANRLEYHPPVLKESQSAIVRRILKATQRLKRLNVPSGSGNVSGINLGPRGS